MVQANTRALVVDGVDDDRRTLIDSLLAHSLHCIGVASIDEARARLASEDFDLVVFDPDSCPDVRAFEELLANRRAKALLVGSPDASSSVEARPSVWLTKPWPESDSLLELLDRALEVPHSPAPSAGQNRALEAKIERLEDELETQNEAIKHTQDAFNQDLSRMMNIVSNIMDGILFIDQESGVKLLNPAAEDLLGVKAFMAIGRSLEDMVGANELLDAVRLEGSNLKDWRETNRVIEVHHSEYDLLYIKLRVSQVLDYRGRKAGTLFQMQDVTAEHKSDQLRNQYLSIVAHQLRTPLTGIKTFSTLMAKGSLGPLNEQQDKVVESIREQSVRLEHQIDKLINLGHIESNDYGHDVEEFDVTELMSQIVEPFEQPAKDHGIVIEVDCPPVGIVLEADRASLKRAIQTLVENAVKFTPEGGHVWVSAIATEERVKFSVRDDGVGIDPRYHRRIFEKFFQVEDPLTRHHGGSGLGLFFVGGIVKAHSAEVRVESELGTGATFSFELPIHTTAPVEAVSTAADS